jgi:hypothetical protein
MGKSMNKRGSDELTEQIVFLIIILIFFVVMLAFVTRFGTRANLKEEIFSKQIALAIDKARSGTSFAIDVSDLYLTARSNHITSNLISIDNTNKRVVVHVVNGPGYSFSFFSDNQISWNTDEKIIGKEKLIINVN